MKTMKILPPEKHFRSINYFRDGFSGVIAVITALVRMYFHFAMFKNCDLMFSCKAPVKQYFTAM